MLPRVQFEVEMREPAPPFEVWGVAANHDARMEKIRQTSNVIQALENVMIQTEDSSDFASLRTAAEDHLARARARLMDAIHQ